MDILTLEKHLKTPQCVRASGRGSEGGRDHVMMYEAGCEQVIGGAGVTQHHRQSHGLKLDLFHSL